MVIKPTYSEEITLSFIPRAQTFLVEDSNYRNHQLYIIIDR